MRAYVFVNADASKSADVVERVRRLDGVKWADILLGPARRWGLVEADTAKALQDFVLNKIQNILGVSQTDTHVVFEV